jgi:hypothetical protein
MVQSEAVAMVHWMFVLQTEMPMRWVCSLVTVRTLIQLVQETTLDQQQDAAKNVIMMWFHHRVSEISSPVAQKKSKSEKIL